MKHARIISGAFQDAFNADALANAVDEDGEVNWGAAFRADPGVRKCPQCKAFYWDEASILECPDCNVQFGSGVLAQETGR